MKLTTINQALKLYNSEKRKKFSAKKKLIMN